MAYTTQAQLERRMGGETITRELIGDEYVYETEMAAIIARADGQIDGYLSSRYAVPVASSGLIEEMSLAIACYELHKLGNGSRVNEKIRQSFEDAIAMLKDISSGKATIPGASAPSGGSISGILSVSSDDSILDGF